MASCMFPYLNIPMPDTSAVILPNVSTKLVCSIYTWPSALAPKNQITVASSLVSTPSGLEDLKILMQYHNSLVQAPFCPAKTSFRNDHSRYSLPLFTPAIHSHCSLLLFTPTVHSRYSLPLLTPAVHSHYSLPLFTSLNLTYGPSVEPGSKATECL